MGGAAATARARFDEISDRRWVKALTLALLLGFAIVLPFLFDTGSPFLDDCVLALAYVTMALGLNVIVGYAGLLDLGYVAFFAIGAYTMGWLGSGFFDGAENEGGFHLLVSSPASEIPGIHLNFVVILIFAVLFTVMAGIAIGLPTLRLRGDYIAVVTLAFGEIVGRIAINGNDIRIGGIWDSTLGALPLIPTLGSEATLTAGKQGVTPVDKVDLPFAEPFGALNLRPWYLVALALVVLAIFVSWRLRDSRQGRAWIALREDEVAAEPMSGKNGSFAMVASQTPPILIWSPLIAIRPTISPKARVTTAM